MIYAYDLYVYAFMYVHCMHHATDYVFKQILYNRSLVQLGMYAFRHGMIKDAHDALMDVQSSGCSKELLAQVSTRPAGVSILVIRFLDSTHSSYM